MFNRQAKKYTDLYPKDPSRFNNDDYAAKWLTGIYNPEYKVKCILKNTPEIRVNIGIVNWPKQSRNITELSEVF